MEVTQVTFYGDTFFSVKEKTNTYAKPCRRQQQSNTISRSTCVSITQKYILVLSLHARTFESLIPANHIKKSGILQFDDIRLVDYRKPFVDQIYTLQSANSFPQAVVLMNPYENCYIWIICVIWGLIFIEITQATMLAGYWEFLLEMHPMVDNR